MKEWKCIDTFSDRQHVRFINVKLQKILSRQLRFLCANIVLSDRQYFFPGLSSGRRVQSQMCIQEKSRKGSKTGPWHGNRFPFRRGDQEDMLIVDFSLNCLQKQRNTSLPVKCIFWKSVFSFPVVNFMPRWSVSVTNLMKLLVIIQMKNKNRYKFEISR